MFPVIAGWVERICEWLKFLSEWGWKQLQCWPAAVGMPGSCYYQEQ